MAIVFAFRVAIVLAPLAYRIVQSASPSLDRSVANALSQFKARLLNEHEDPAQLSLDMSASTQEAWNVTDFTGSFELRKLQFRISRAPAGANEDVDVIGIHFIKATGGTVGTWSDSVDLPKLEARLTTFWNIIAPNVGSWMHADQYRWYKDGPAFWQLDNAKGKYVPIPGNAATRVTEIDIPGTLSGATNMLPPQNALSITKVCSSRAHWGRFYLPNMGVSNVDQYGRVPPSFVTGMSNAAVAMFNGFRTDGCPAVIFSVAKPERPNAKGTILPAQAAIAFEVTHVQVDDIWDVIRSRRWSTPITRVRTALT